MNIKQKISIYVTSTLFIISICAYSIFWFSYSSAIQGKIKQLTITASYPEFKIETSHLKTSNFPFSPSTEWSGNIHINGKDISVFIPSAIIEGFAIGHMDIAFKLPQGFSIGKDEWESINIIDALNIVITTPPNFMKALNKSEALRWRNSGGKVKIKPSSIKAKGITINGDGDFYLDEKLQIAGTLNVTIKNPRNFVKILSDNNALDDLTILILNGLITTLAKKDKNTDKETIETTIKISDNKLYLGMIQLGDVPNIVW